MLRITQSTYSIDEETGVSEDRADYDGGETYRHCGLQEQEDRQAASVAGYTTGIQTYSFI